MSKRHARRVTKERNPSKPRWRAEGRKLQQENARLRIDNDGLARNVATDQELFEALRRDTGIEARTGEELIASVVNELARLRKKVADVAAAATLEQPEPAAEQDHNEFAV